MTKQETAKIITLLREFYPQGKEITEATINAWHELLKGYDYEEVWVVAVEVAKEYEGYTLPPPSVLLNKHKSLTTPLAIEYWNIALKAIKKGQSFTQEDFEKLPTAIQTYFGGISQVRDLGQMDMDTISYEKARFLKNIDVITKREESDKAFIENRAVRELAEKTT